MRWRVKLIAPFVLALALFAPACDDSPLDARSVRLGEPFVVAVGEIVSVRENGLQVGLLQVVSDSRCPIDVTCAQVVPGKATIRVAVELGAIPAAVLVLDSESGSTARGSYAGFAVTFTAIAPQQRSDVTIAPGDYRVTLVVSDE